MSKQRKKNAPPAAALLKPSIFDRFEEHPMWHILILLIVPFFIYIKTVGFDFIHLNDTDIFLNKDAYLFRPVSNLSFALDAIIGSGRTWIYHLSNIIYHLLTVISLYSLLRALKINNLAAFILSFFFALHPLLAGTVSYIPARADVLIGLWITLSLLTFCKYIKTGKVLHLVLHILFFALAVFTKETAVLFPVLLLFYYSFILNEKINSKRTVLFFIAWVVVIAVFFFLRSKVITTDLSAGAIGINAFINNLPTLPILLAKAFIPVNLSTMPLFDSTFVTLGSILLLLLLIVVVKKTFNKQFLPLLGYIWFLLLLAACLPFQLKDSKLLQAYSEQEVYLPVIGLIILLACLLHEKLQQASREAYTWLSLLIVLIFIPLASVYSDSYKDSDAYFGRAADLNNPGAYTKRGEEYINNTPKDYVNALADFNSAVEISGGTYAPAYYDLGRATADYLKNHQDAETDFTQAILLDPTMIDPYIDRADERLKLQNASGAVSDLMKAESIDSTDSRIYYTFGKVYIGARNFPLAIEKYSKAIVLNNYYTEAYTDRALAYYQLNDYPRAIQDCNKAISINRSFFTAYYNKAMVYYAMNKMDTTLKLLDTTLALADNFYFGYFYRGMAKKQLHDMKGACSDWQESLSLGFTMAADTIKRYCK
jgi:tetratricopeptide (TPR) repeat protein